MRNLRFLGSMFALFLVICVSCGCRASITTTRTENYAASQEEAPNSWLKTELYFGFESPNGPVQPNQFQAFLDKEVSPRFPDGFTTLVAQGQWAPASSPGLQKEDSRLVILCYQKATDVPQKIASICQAYKEQFNQESVMEVTHEARVKFH